MGLACGIKQRERIPFPQLVEKSLWDCQEPQPEADTRSFPLVFPGFRI